MGQDCSEAPITLDATTFPLHGHRLIEASAGTGKTYTIANLYLRLLIGHGSEKNKAVRVLTPKEILVVTFTEAATQELRHRIRTRIHEARQVFSGLKSPSESDPLLQQVFAELADHKHIAKLLLLAERQMDEASIFTIHGFCHRLLNQHAFESGSLFTLTLTTDDSQLLQQAATDFWRQTFYNLPLETAEILYKSWTTPTKLLNTLRPWLYRDNVTIITHKPANLEQRYNVLKTLVTEIKTIWLASSQDILDTIFSSDVNKQSYRKNTTGKWAEEVTRWSKGTELVLPKNIDKFSYIRLKEKTKAGGKAPCHPFFEHVDTLLALPNTFKDIFIEQALKGIKNRLNTLKTQQHTLVFDDLLTHVDNALQHPGNHRLREQIRTSFPIAIIDEFQDTDPLQYQIFNTLYPQNDIHYGLLMIGDPKQAIYAFRGADIFTYINARRMTPSRFTLPVNWRSTSTMVDACNTLFAQSAQPFIYYKDIPFSATKAAPGADQRYMHINGKTPSAIALWCQTNTDTETPSINKETYTECMTSSTVQEIKYLLTLAKQGLCTLYNQQKQRALKASDIAILVRTGTQAQKIRSALADIDIPSVYLSERDSVFNTREAKEIYRILNACLTPENETLLRAALATSLLNLNAETLDDLREDESAWENIIEEFVDYQQYWQQRGVLALLRQLLFKRGITQRLLAAPMGERRLTDITHIGELLASAAQTLDSTQALVHWLWRHIQDAANDPTFQLHLESDRNLVRIITIHKSKGLEYPVVFMPYVCDWKEADTQNGCFFHQVPDNQPTLDLTSRQENKKQAEKERLAEDIRLLYVGVTRAVYRCYMGIAPIRKGNAGKNKTNTHLHKTAIGHLLNDTQGLSNEQLYEKLCVHWGTNPALISIDPPPVYDATPYRSSLTAPETLTVRSFGKPIQRNWTVTSYSALSTNNHHTPAYERPGLEDELPSTPETAPNEPEYTIYTFPKGARAGVFLHALFEKIDFVQAKQLAPAEQIEKALLHEGFEPEWQSTLETLVNTVLNATMHPESFCLGDINHTNKYVELEFHLPLALLHANKLNSLIMAFDPLSKTAGELSFQTIQGMLKGFIDLVFVHNNKYYMVDYKSNFLGDSPAHYHQSALRQAMVEHRYDFQYQLYTLAIHRLLKQRLPNYRYDTHMGGVFYLFLRGMQPPQAYSNGDHAHNEKEASGIFFTRPDRQLIEQLDQLFAGASLSQQNANQHSYQRSYEQQTKGPGAC